MLISPILDNTFFGSMIIIMFCTFWWSTRHEFGTFNHKPWKLNVPVINTVEEQWITLANIEFVGFKPQNYICCWLESIAENL